jgi:hypothetical protein
MNVNLQQEKQTILDAWGRTKGGAWATPPQISKFSGIDLETVLRIIYNSREFMSSESEGDDGLPIFASRKLYKERTPFWNKLIDFLIGDYV